MSPLTYALLWTCRPRGMQQRVRIHTRTRISRRFSGISLSYLRVKNYQNTEWIIYIKVSCLQILIYPATRNFFVAAAKEFLLMEQKLANNFYDIIYCGPLIILLSNNLILFRFSKQIRSQLWFSCIPNLNPMGDIHMYIYVLLWKFFRGCAPRWDPVTSSPPTRESSGSKDETRCLYTCACICAFLRMTEISRRLVWKWW